MSLNAREIDLILDELTLIDSSVQKVVQRNVRDIYLGLYSHRGEWWLRICLAHPNVRLHRTLGKPRVKRSHQRFEEFLVARIRGSRIVAVEHCYHDRIVRLEMVRSDQRTFVYVRLWGPRANLIVTTPDGTILDAAFRKPAEGIESGGHFLPQPPDREHAPRSPRRRREGVTFNEQIAEEYREAEAEQTVTRLRERLARLATRELRRLEARIGELEKGLTGDSGDDLQHYGDLILANLYRIAPRDEWVETDDYDEPGKTVRIPLDPKLSANENAQRFYDRSRAARETRQQLATTRSVLGTRHAQVERDLADLTAMDIDELRSRLEFYEAERTRRTGSGERASAPGLSFVSAGHTILVGRNAKENDLLLRRAVRGNDWWLHTRDDPGGYVFIKAQRGKSVPLEVLLDAGNLAVFFSKARRAGRADLYYTQVKYLRRAKDGPLGLVLPTQEKNLAVELDSSRLARLGIHAGLET